MNKVLGNKKSIAVFVLPAFLIYAAFVLIPIAYNIYVSFLQTDLMSPSKFVGLKNYVNLFKDSTFTGALKNNILMVIGSLIAHLPLALFFGNILFQKIKGSHFFQTVFFLPSFICGVAVGLTWTFIYNSEFGLLNKLLGAIGLGSLQHVWLSDKKLALLCIIVVVMWQFVGYHMIIQIAAMKNIPTSYYEAAEIDGASRWQRLWNSTIPSVVPLVVMMFTMQIGLVFMTGFDKVLLLYMPTTYEFSDCLSTYTYRMAFSAGNDFSLSTASGLLQSIIGTLLLIFGNKMSEKATKMSLF